MKILANLVFLFLLAKLCASLKRNVVIILADDLGLEISVYNNTICKTPNLQQLSEKSVIFRNAYTTVSSCSPSRASLLTGLPTHQNGMFGLHNTEHHFNSFEAVRSLPAILKKHGIKTGIIGKKHVGPESVYRFDFEVTEEQHPILQVGRNVTLIKEYVRQFLNESQTPFLLYVAFHDPHRCGHTHPQFGPFCEKFGSGEPGMGIIPDWKPPHYNPSEIEVPYYMPNTIETKEDLAAYYTTISRLDTGVGLVLKELENSGHKGDTLIIFSSDNGPSFPNGRTNLYDPAVREPFLISNPRDVTKWGKTEDSSVTLLDVVPTVLDWFNIPYPNYNLFRKRVVLTGESLLPLTFSTTTIPKVRDNVFFSHNLHEATMYYPMRALRNKQYKLIHNLNYWSPFPIDQDFYLSRTFQGILHRTRKGEPLFWSKNLTTYYKRNEWELFDLTTDSHELNNIYEQYSNKSIVKKMKRLLFNWQNSTNDPWMCSPHYVLEQIYSIEMDTCLPLFNKL